MDEARAGAFPNEGCVTRDLERENPMKSVDGGDDPSLLPGVGPGPGDHVRERKERLSPPEDEEGAPLPPLGEILDVEAVQAVMDAFFALTQIGVAVIDLRGRVLVATGWQDICTKFHRVHPETAKHCMESDTILSAGVAPGTYRRYRCKNNLWDMATPITAGTRHVGNLFLGQFLFGDEHPDYACFRAQARRYGFEEGPISRPWTVSPDGTGMSWTGP